MLGREGPRSGGEMARNCALSVAQETAGVAPAPPIIPTFKAVLIAKLGPFNPQPSKLLPAGFCLPIHFLLFYPSEREPQFFPREKGKNKNKTSNQN